jgi:hypothetical protein
MLPLAQVLFGVYRATNIAILAMGLILLRLMVLRFMT